MALYSLSPGVAKKTLDAVAVGAALKSAGYGVPDTPHKGPRTVTWRTAFTGGPAAVNSVLQGAINDVDAEYFTLDTSTATAGETRMVKDVRVRFLRTQLVSHTGGTLVTHEVLI